MKGRSVLSTMLSAGLFAGLLAACSGGSNVGSPASSHPQRSTPAVGTPSTHPPAAQVDACTVAADMGSDLPALAASGDYIGTAAVARTYAGKLQTDLPALPSDSAGEVQTLISDLTALAHSTSLDETTSNMKRLTPHILRFATDFCGAG
jgi:hypothetical protein